MKDYLPAPEVKSSILRARAKALARAPDVEEEIDDTVEVVEFLLANERYAVEAKYVREVYPLKELTPLPCTPRFVSGIINVRGQIVSVMDLKRIFDLPETPITDSCKVIIARTDGMESGILADLLIGVRPLRLTELQPALPTLAGIHADYLKGVTHERLVVLEIEKILRDSRIVVNESV